MKKYVRLTCALLALLCLCVCAVSCNSDGNDDKNDGAAVAFYAEYKGTKIELGAPADSIIAALGEAQNRVEIGDCGGLGAQVKYSYPSIDVYVLESKTDGNIIDQITFRDDSVTTPNGSYIGMTADDAKAAEGKPSTESATALVYQKGSYALKLTLADGYVAEINFLTITQG